MKSKVFKTIFMRSVWALITVFFAIVFVILAVAKEAVKPHERWIDRYFGVRRTFLVDDEPKEGEEPVDTNYYPSVYDIFTGEYDGDDPVRNLDELIKMQKDALDISKKVNDEGMTLLWNKNNALPLSKTAEKNVSTFGVHSLAHLDGKNWVDNWIYHGTGSANIDLRKNVGMVEENGLNIGPRLPLSLENRNIDYNQKLLDSTWKFLENKETPNGYDAVQTGQKKDRKEVTWEQLSGDTENDPIGTMKSSYNDAAIYTIGRYEGEGKDVKDKLSLTAEEKSVLAGLSELRASNQVKKLIVVLIFPNPMNMKEFEGYNIDACLWAGYGGNTATEAVCDVLWGDVNPSGHLVDTWAYDSSSAPASVNYGDKAYANNSQIDTNYDEGEHNDAYVVYQEGIYVGYRYYETRYEDKVLNRGNADAEKGVVAGSGKWNYGAEVAYPFGYGNGYTSFEYSNYQVNRTSDENGKTVYEVSMTITNKGSVAGKDVMQVYLQKPYTEYDKKHGIEKAAVELVGYAKTEVLAPSGQEGSSQRLTVTVPEYEFKTYDMYGNKTYILEKGDYYLAAGSDAHSALNNILAMKGKTVADGMDAAGSASLVYKTHYGSDDVHTYSKAIADDDVKVTNQFDDADLNLYEGTSNQKIKYLSRNNWNETYPTAMVELTATEKIINDLKYEQTVPNNPNDKMPKEGTGKLEDVKIKLIQMRGVPFDDPLWDDFLDQFSYANLVELLRTCARPLENFAIPEGDVYDGPCGLRDGFIDHGARVAYPCAPIVAATFNDKLIEEMAENYGEVLRAHGTQGVWGISTNIHRLPYNGRNWEYFAEDGFLAGKMNAAETRGLTDKGIIVYTKHFAVNNIEINRNGINTWANEQTIREIYLKAFEAGVTEAPANGMMTSYNRLGCEWTGTHKGLITNVLKNEWGFIGVIATDYPERPYMGQGHPSIVARSVIAGQDEWLKDVVGNGLDGDEYKNNATLRIALRDSARRNLYTRVNSCIVNGVSSSTRVVIVTPAWQQAISTAEIVFGVIMGVCALMTAACWVFWYLGKREAANE